MIPILYSASETSFVSNGIARLIDCVSCKVEEQRNGEYKCEFQYPVYGAHYEDIQDGCIILATHDNTGDMQPFDIYHHTAPIDGIVTFYASHISYRLNGIPVKPFKTTTNIAAAMAGLKTNSIGTNPFTLSTDKTTTGEFEITKPSSLRAMLGGTEGSLLDTFGTGEYEWNKFAVTLHARRGIDTDVQIRYGKNLSDIERDVDYINAYNAVVPFWAGTEDQEVGEETISVDVLVTLPEWVLYAEGVTPYNGRNTIIPLDMSDQFEEKPTVESLRTAAQTYINTSEAWLPSDNIKVDFVQLWQTEEYKDYAPLQAVNLTDTVTVIYPKLGINGIRSKVITTVYDTLLDRYEEIELGNPLQSYAAAITSGLDSKMSELEDGLTIIRQAAQEALADAVAAREAADSAEAQASNAYGAAQSAVTQAGQAYTAAQNAQTAADNAQTSADSAITASGQAYTAAVAAQTQLSQVEDVVGALQWITEHGYYVASTDTSVNTSKIYYTLTGTAIASPTGNPSENGYYELVSGKYVRSSDTAVDGTKTYYQVTASMVAAPTGSPVANDYYELEIDEAVSQYINAHISLDSSGLHVTDGSQSSVQISASGVTIYGSNGQVVGQYGEGAIIGNELGYHIKITGERLSFMNVQTEVAYMTGDRLYIPRVVVVRSMQAGNWLWDAGSDYHLTLKWNEEVN